MPTQASQLPLKDIHLPAQIGWWPPAIGWWLLAGLLIVLVCSAVWLYKRLTRKTALKTASKLLLTLKQDNSLDNAQKLRQLSALMRRVAISQYPRNETASLIGDAWLQFLDQGMKGMPFSTGIGRVLAEVPFQANLPPDLDMPQLMQLCETWLKANRKPITPKALNK